MSIDKNRKIISKGGNMTLKVPFGCANCMQGPAWGQNSAQYNAVKIDIHQPEIKTEEPKTDKKLYDYPSASVYDTEAPNKAPITPPFEITVPKGQKAAGLIEDSPEEVAEETPQLEEESAQISDETQIEEPIVSYAEGEATSNSKSETSLNDSFEAHNPLNHYSINKQKLAFGASEKVGKLDEPKNQGKPVFDTNEVVKTLNSKDLKEQTIGLATIAFICEENPNIAKQFLNPQIIKALTDVLKQDSKKLAGPTPEQIKLRKEVMEGKKLSDEQMKIAVKTSPMEMSERNKQFAIYTIALLDTVLINEFDKNNKTSSQKVELEMRDLPGMNEVVNVLQTNPNPVLRTTAVEALYFISKPDFNPVIKPILKAATNDKDIKVSETAKKALANIDKKAQNVQQKQNVQQQQNMQQKQINKTR